MNTSQAAEMLTRLPPVEQEGDSRGRGSKQQPVPRRRNRWFVAMVMVMGALAASVVLSVFILDSAQDLFGLNQPDQWIEVTIPENATVKQVADLLEQKGIITQSLTFQLYARLKEKDGEPLKFYDGNYNFNKNYGYDQLMLLLQYRHVILSEVRVTFPEGLTVHEIARKLEENRVCKADAFLEYLQTAEFDYEFVDRIPESYLRFRRMEGYVFPDTYDFYEGESVANVAKKFLDNFERRINSADLEGRMANMGLTLDETIILASIIQKETGGDSQMGNVSAVFHNRLNNTAVFPTLDSDVTIFYVEDWIKPYIMYQNQEMYDAYNTYVTHSIPVGPICNPGLAAIEAALNPAPDIDYTFFVTDYFGGYYYSTTANEHNANVRIAEDENIRQRMAIRAAEAEAAAAEAAGENDEEEEDE